jgi:hypothetical protein
MMNNPITAMLNGSGASGAPSTTSLDLPPALAGILSMGSQPSGAGVANPMNSGMSSGMGSPATFAPSYEVGGMIGPGGMPEPSGVGLAPQGQQGGMDPQMMDMQLKQFASQHPQQVAQIRGAIVEVMQTGELTQEELNMVVQLATVAAQNPEMYSHVRKFAIQNGIASDQDLPAQYDQGLVFVLLLAAKAVQADMGGQNMMQGGSPAMTGGGIPSMAKGGATPESKNADGSVLINAHEGEFVIPANVVKMKGREFFDNLVEKYRDVP